MYLSPGVWEYRIQVSDLAVPCPAVNAAVVNPCMTMKLSVVHHKPSSPFLTLTRFDLWSMLSANDPSHLALIFSSFPHETKKNAEPILNEHPVTIYPGRASPTRRMPPRTLSGSIERHRDVCRGTGANPYAGSDNSTSTSQENSSPENNESEYNESSLSPTHGHLNPLGATLASRIFHPSAQSSPIVAPVVLASNQPFLLQPHRGQRGAASSTTKAKTGPAGARTSRHDSDDDERFSDDSLEDSSLPPPPGPPTVPPPPSLSAPVTPSKRHSIAWEVNLDDPASFGDPLAPIPPKPSASAPSAKVGCTVDSPTLP